MRAASLTLRAVPRLALLLPRRLRRRLIAAALLALTLAGIWFGWFRDSSLVQVRDVTVEGLTGPDAPRVRKALEQAGLGMTTLHVKEEDLRRAVEAEPSIRSISAVPDFPHGLRIDVLENHPVAAVAIAGKGRVPLAGNGTLLPGLESKASVPELKVTGSARAGNGGPAPARLKDESAARLLRVAATAPVALLGRAESIGRRRGEGIVVVMRDGPRLIFGTDDALPEKWRAVAGVLASKHSQGAAYVDVRLPQRPVAGGLKAQIDPAGAPTATGDAAVTPAPAAPSTPAGGSTTTPAQPQATTPATPPAAPSQAAPAVPQAPPTNSQP